jgi:hypothetical protein
MATLFDLPVVSQGFNARRSDSSAWSRDACRIGNRSGARVVGDVSPAAYFANAAPIFFFFAAIAPPFPWSTSCGVPVRSRLTSSKEDGVWPAKRWSLPIGTTSRTGAKSTSTPAAVSSPSEKDLPVSLGSEKLRTASDADPW